MGRAVLRKNSSTEMVKRIHDNYNAYALIKLLSKPS